MDMQELCARNISAALREASNAHLAARAGGAAEELTADLIERACELLSRASIRLGRPPVAPLPAVSSEPVAVAPVPSGQAEEKVPAQRNPALARYDGKPA